MLCVGYETLIAFAVFTLGGAAVYSAVPARFKKYALLTVSLACFTYLARFGVIILLIESAITYYAARVIDGVGRQLPIPQEKEEKKIQKQKIKKQKQLIFGLYAAVMILMLVLFKNLGAILSVFGENTVFNVLLNTSVLSTVGMSYYTLQAIGYVLDVERKTVKSEESFLDVLLFCSFFPQLNEGPFSRAKELMPQLKNCGKLRLFNAESGVAELLLGLFKLFVIADRAAIIVSTVFSQYESYSGIETVWGVLAFTLQLYADLSGYINIASGVSKIFGITLPKNFDLPFAASSVGEFWRRWHISLSTWLKDYVYIPLGGSRCSKGRNYWNIFVTFLVSGIWHGANWTFIFWGILHGVFQVIEKMLGCQKCTTSSKLIRFSRILLTFVLVCIAWIFFRQPTISDAFGVIERILTEHGTLFKPSNKDVVFSLLSIGIVVCADLIREFQTKKFYRLVQAPIAIRWCMYYALLLVILLCGVFDSSQFIYVSF